MDFKYDLPRLYQRLFSLDPLQDRRFMSAHKEIIEKLIGHYGDIEMGGRRILITGESGMGKTSLLNVCQMDFINANILRIDLDSRNSKN